MVIGVIDIGTNTTRLLVAEVRDGAIAAEARAPAFPLRGLRGGGRGASGLLEREAATRGNGSEALISVGTALRGTCAARGLDRACARIGAGGLRILSAREEAALAFLGATSCEPAELPESVAVVDVGGGSTEVVVGTPGQPPGWWASRPVGLAPADRAGAALGPPHSRSAGRRPKRRRAALRRSGAAGLRARAGGGRRGHLAAPHLAEATIDRTVIAGLFERLGRRRARSWAPSSASPPSGLGCCRRRWPILEVGLRAAARAAADRPGRSAGGAGAGALRPRRGGRQTRWRAVNAASVP